MDGMLDMAPPEVSTIKLGDIAVDVVLKDIKNVHLSVYPPHGAVRISAPRHMKFETVRVFVISKLSWIKRERKKLQDQARETPRAYLDRESHYVWGERYLLRIEERNAAPQVSLEPRHLVLQVRPGTDSDKRHAIIARWYRLQVRAAATELISKWPPITNVTVSQVFVQKMKTKWGSANPTARSIRLNVELAKKPRPCLEYIVVHEMAHLIEPTHNERFQALMDHFLPKWRNQRDELNATPLAYEQWKCDSPSS